MVPNREQAFLDFTVVESGTQLIVGGFCVVLFYQSLRVKQGFWPAHPPTSSLQWKGRVKSQKSSSLSNIQ